MSQNAQPDRLSEAQQQALAAAYRRIMESVQHRREAQTSDDKKEAPPLWHPEARP